MIIQICNDTRMNIKITFLVSVGYFLITLQYVILWFIELPHTLFPKSEPGSCVVFNSIFSVFLPDFDCEEPRRTSNMS